MGGGKGKGYGNVDNIYYFIILWIRGVGLNPFPQNVKKSDVF